ncbi:integrase domain-containing protein [Pseudoalteromonas sp. CuT4-3]|uniref:integrase domain-containing protein n=1 Tax=Pseudoalteromonas sp. CuT4-3 TaxID=3112573 RepID=UPI002D764C33|nr:integrase domain-containing protein [Pseudoalteromonas sp. CuT 4-3]WRU72118.1 integrase domain-containing protein [Pseudoalteromonas sp. CuT 4-3]
MVYIKEMARTVKPLNDTQIKQAKPKEKEYLLSDGSGLQLSIRPNGTKSWIFKYYKPLTKKRTNISFGQYPQITLAAARVKREEARGLLANEKDPKEFKEQQYIQETQARLNTLEKVAMEWFEIHKPKIKPKHAEGILGKLKNHVFPELGKRPISSIDAVVTINALRPVAAKGTLETVRKTCQVLNQVMGYAVNTGIIKHNPLERIRDGFAKPITKPMPTIDASRLSEFMADLSRASIKFPTRCAIEWQLHTMVRPNEATKAKWSEIDLENNVWIIPAEKMKAAKVHKIPLTPRTLKLLELMSPISGHREFIFPADRNPRDHMNPQTPNAAISRMGYKGELVAHGLRSLASTVLNESRLFDYELIEVALAHQDTNQVRAAYNRSDYLESRREMMCWWSEYIHKAKVQSLV